MGQLLFTIIESVAQILSIAIFLRAILSWFPNISRYNPMVEMLYQVTEPILVPLRRVLPSMGMMDLSPLIAMILLQFVPSMLAPLFLAF